jgi:hypothetical protein
MAFAILYPLSSILCPAQTFSGLTMQSIRITTNQPAAGGGGGGAAYTNYSAAGFTPANQQGWAGDWFLGAAVTCTNAGQITKIGAYLHNEQVGVTHDVKLSLWWNNGGTWTFVECGSVTLAEQETAWKDFTLASPYTVTAGQVVRVFMVGELTWTYQYYGATTGGYSGTKTYANGCNSTMPSVSDDFMFAARTHVQQ